MLYRQCEVRVLPGAFLPMSVADTTNQYVQDYAGQFRTADESNYDELRTTLEILETIQISNGREDLDAEYAEQMLKDLGFCQLINSSGAFWMFRRP